MVVKGNGEHGEVWLQEWILWNVWLREWMMVKGNGEHGEV